MRRDQRGALGIGLLAGGVVLALALAVLIGVVLPVTDPALGKEASGSPRMYTRTTLEGRTLYIREGCFTCHSIQVRDALADSVLGPRFSEPGDYFNEAPSLIGEERIGPDLTCVGNRQTDEKWHVSHLRRPSSVRKDSNMPSYAYLSTHELMALARFLLALTCKG